MNPTGTFTLQPTPGPRQPKTRGVGKAAHQFDRQNTIAAHVILTDPDAYGGEEALAVKWARLAVAA
jgi:hypothetical protein